MAVLQHVLAQSSSCLQGMPSHLLVPPYVEHGVFLVLSAVLAVNGLTEAGLTSGFVVFGLESSLISGFLGSSFGAIP